MAQACPAVDDEENVAERIVSPAALPRSARWASRDADDRFHFGDHAPDQLRLGPAGDSAHMGQCAHRRQCSAAEIETVELHLAWIVRGRQCGDQCAQCRRLARLRCAYDCDIACGSCKSTISGVRDCSKGRSTMPMGTVRSPVTDPASRNRATKRGAGPSGGSQTWCAAGPCPDSRSRTARRQFGWGVPTVSALRVTVPRPVC